MTPLKETTKDILVIVGIGIIFSALLVALVHSTDEHTQARHYQITGEQL